MSSREHIAQIILQLLPKHKRIAIPGIGCVTVKQLEQYLGSGEGLILPPTSRILITPVRENDQDLITLSRSENLLNKKKEKRLVREVRLLVNEVLNFGTASLGSLGTLRKMENGQIVLDSLPDVINRDSYLLPSLEIKPVVKEADPEPVVVQDINQLPGQDEEFYGAFSAGSFWAKYGFPVIAIVIISLLLIFVLRWAFGVQQVLSHVDERDPATEVSVRAQEADMTALSASSENAHIDHYRQEMTEEAVTERCVVVVGSFSNTENAIRMADRIKSLGYPLYRGGGSPTRIGIRFDCPQIDPGQFLRQIQAEIEPRAWMLIP